MHAEMEMPLKLTSVDKVLAWMQTHGIPMRDMDLIAQDEFTHDLLVAWQGRWIAFGLT